MQSRQIIFYILIIAIITTLLYYLGTELAENHIFSQEGLRKIIEKSGKFSWIIFTLFIALSVLGPFPSSIIVLIGAYLFTPLITIILTVIGEVLGASGNFFIGKKLGKKLILRKFPKTAQVIERYEGHLSPHNIFLLSLIPIGTSNVTGYIAGISNVKYRDYIIPWIVGILLLNSSISLLGYSAQIQSLWLSISLIALIIIIFVVVRKYLKTHFTK